MRKNGKTTKTFLIKQRIQGKKTRKDEVKASKKFDYSLDNREESCMMFSCVSFHS